MNDCRHCSETHQKIDGKFVRMQYLPVFQLGTEKLEGWKHMYRYAMKDAQCSAPLCYCTRGSARVSFPYTIGVGVAVQLV